VDAGRTLQPVGEGRWTGTHGNAGRADAPGVSRRALSVEDTSRDAGDAGVCDDGGKGGLKVQPLAEGACTPLDLTHPPAPPKPGDLPPNLYGIMMISIRRALQASSISIWSSHPTPACEAKASPPAAEEKWATQPIPAVQRRLPTLG